MNTLLLNLGRKTNVFLTILFLLVFNSAFSTTYYLQNASVASASTASSWRTDSTGAGGGTAATNFTTDGDIFNTRSGQSAIFASSITLGSNAGGGDGVIINIVSGSTATINTGVTITLSGKNSRESEFNVSGTVIFGLTAKISLSINNAGNTFSLASGATLKTANATGVLGTNCSVEKTGGASATATLDTGANYEFNGGAQAMLGMPTTVNDLTFSGTLAKTYSLVTTVSGNFTMSGSTTSTPTMTTIGGNINLSGTAVMTTGANNVVTGSLTVGTGSTLSMGGFSLSIGTTSSITGTVNTVTAATGTKTFTGAVTINSGGVWNLSGQNPATSFGGGITMSGTTFNNGTGAAAFSANQSLAGANNMTFGGTITPVSGVTLTNSNTGTVTVSSTGSIVLTGNFTQGASSNLTLAANTPFSGAGTFNASSNTNTVTYTGANVAVRPTTYSSLTINGSGTATIGGATTVNATMTVSSATTNNNTLTVTGALSGASTLTQGSGSVLNIAGTSGITGLNASTNANTVNYTGAAQTVKAVAYSALSFSGTGNKTIATGTSVAGNLTITGVKADVGTGLSINVNNLTLGTLGTNAGTWGSTSSGATYTNNTYFTATNGVLNVTADTRQTPTVTPTVGTYTYTGLAQGPNAATNTGTGSSYTFSYNGTGGTTYGPSATQPTNAGTYTVTVTVAASTDGFYKSNSSSATAFSIGTRALTITANDGSKTYGQTYTVGSGTTAFTPTGLQNGETIGTITIASTGAVNTATVGSYNIVPSAATGGTFTASNYSITYTNGTLTVNAASLTITANNGTKVYGTTQSTPVSGAITFGSTGLQNGETIGSVTLTYGAGALAATDAVGSTSTITASAAIGGTFTASNYSITYTPNSGTLTVTAAPLTITANNGTKVYGTTQSTPVSGATTFGSTGLQNGETIGSVTLTYGAGALAATDAVGSTSTITPSAATGGTFTASNYSITYTPNSGTLTVTAAPLTITANDGSKTYGQTYTVGAGSTAFTPTGLQNSETIGSITIASTGAVNTAAVGSYNIVPSLATGGTFTASNYNITYTNGTLTVNTAPLTITANDGSKTYGQTYTVGAGSTAFTPTGLQNSETIGTITIASTGAVNTAAVGSYNIVPSLATGGTFTASNYSITYTNGTLTVNQASLTITANDGTKVYGTTQSTPVTGATTFGSTGLQNGESIGTVTLTYGSGALAATDAVGSTSTITPSAATGGTFTAGNYSITYTPGTLTVITAPLTITADNAAKCFGTTYTLGSTAFSSIGLQNSETIGSVTLNSSGAISSAAVGSYSIVPSAATGGTFTASNYSITYVNGTLTVNALPSAPAGTDGERCSTGTVNLSASVSGGETVDWYSASSGGTLLLSNSTSYTTPSISTTTIYYAEARNTTTDCVSSTRTAVTATVYPTSVGGAVSSDQTICSGTQPADLTLAGNTGAVVKWQSSSDVGFTSPTDISNTSTTLTGATIGNLTANTYFRAVVQSGICSSANSSAVLITIDAVSVGGTVSANQTICYGTEPADLTLSGNTGSVIKWQSSSDAGFTSPTDIAETSTTLDGVTIGALTSATYFRAVVQSGVCSVAYSASVLISIDALTVGGSVSANQTICTGTAPSDLTLSGHTGSVIKWESSVDAGFTSPTDILVTSTTLTGATIGNLTQDTYFRAVVQNGSCEVEESAAVLITVSEETVAGSVDGGTAICSGSTSGLLTLTGYTGDVIRWEYSVSPFTSWVTIANTNDTYTSGALTQTTQFRAVVQNGACPEVYSTETTVDINTTTWSSGAWSNGTPDGSIITEAIIASSYTSAGENINACSLTVNNGVTVVISSGDTVTLSGALTAISGSFVTFNNNANLIQSGSTNSNSGSVIFKRDSSPLYRLDYTSWSSPVANQNIKAFSPGTLDNRFYTHDTATNTYVAVPSVATTNFTTAKGYLIRMPNSWPAYVPPTPPTDPQIPGGTIWHGFFTGVPHNGDYSFTLVDGGAANLRYNLVGNPYPSPIDATAFVSNPTNFANTTATLYLQRKTNYYSARPSYSTWTTAGYTDNGEPGRTLADWNGYLQIGQGFFVEASGAGTSLVFDNSMRVDNHDNQFFRNAAPATNSIERNRIWLNATDSNGVFSQTMVGYITNATQGVDATIDGKYFNDGEITLTSLINDVPYAIQGRSLPFDTNDVVPLYFKVSTAGNYTITIDHVDGLFTGATQAIYLKDNLTTTIHDLNTGAYSFASDAGTFANRFEIIYSLPLGTQNPTFTADNVVIYSHNDEFVVNTGNTIMSSVKVFDIRGRLLQEKKDIDASQTTIGNGLANQVLLVQITSADGVVITKKVIR